MEEKKFTDEMRHKIICGIIHDEKRKQDDVDEIYNQMWVRCHESKHWSSPWDCHPRMVRVRTIRGVINYYREQDDALNTVKKRIRPVLFTSLGVTNLQIALASAGECCPSLKHIENKDFWENAMKLLPKVAQDLLELRYMYGKTFSEVGEIMECPQSTVISRHSKIIESLRKGMSCENL